MGRSPLGAAARTLSVTVKVSENEKKQLRKLGYRTPGLAARHALDLFLAEKGEEGTAKAVVDPVAAREAARAADLAALERVAPRVTPQVTTPCRIHRSYEVVKQWAEFGTRWETKVCRDCGYEKSDQVHP